MGSQCVLVISKKPLLREGLKRLIEERGLATVVVAPDDETALSVITEADPDLIVTECPNIKPSEALYFGNSEDKPTKVIVLGWDDDKLAVYSRERVLPATMQHFIGVVRECLMSVS